MYVRSSEIITGQSPLASCCRIIKPMQIRNDTLETIRHDHEHQTVFSVIR